jgi:AAA+ superfamily predicted ATPase
VVAVAATNHPELLDRAVWRRFQLRLELPAPTPAQVREWLTRLEKGSELGFGVPLGRVAEVLKSASFAELTEFSLDVRRSLVLGGPSPNVRGIVAKLLSQWKARAAVRR